MALKLFHLMALRGIDGRREGAQKSIKNEKGEIKSSPSHHLLKWVYSLLLLEHRQPCLISPHPIPAFTFISSLLIPAPFVFLSFLLYLLIDSLDPFPHS